jgi:hypothetical protein
VPKKVLEVLLFVTLLLNLQIFATDQEFK